jgi:hypothetical protein
MDWMPSSGPFCFAPARLGIGITGSLHLFPFGKTFGAHLSLMQSSANQFSFSFLPKRSERVRPVYKLLSNGIRDDNIHFLWLHPSLGKTNAKQLQPQIIPK